MPGTSLHGGDRGPLERRRPPLTVSLRGSPLRRSSRSDAAGADRPRREVEREGRNRPAAHHQSAAAGRERQLPRRDRRADRRRFSRSKASSTISARAPTLDPAQARAMQKLPAVVKARAAGGTAQTRTPRDFERPVDRRSSSPEDTFGVLRDLLQGLESRLSYVRQRRRAPGSAGRGDAVDLAGARLADGHLRRPSRSVHRRAGLPPGPRHLDRKGPAGLRDGRRHGRVGVATPATTAT